MSFNRTNYDFDAYNLQMSRNNNIENYRFLGEFAENVNQCYTNCNQQGAKSDVSLVRKLDDLSFASLAENESNLSWRNNKLSKSNDNFYTSIQKVYNKPDCPCLLSEDTRFSNPIDNYRSMSLTSYHYTPYLIINPLSKFQNLNEKHGLSSRIISKDTFKLEKNKN